MSRVLPSPADLLGAPDLRSRFGDWHPGQADVFGRIMDWYHSSQRFVGLSAPTGTGKSLSALLAARVSGARTVIVTASKGLQQQYIADCRPLGGVLAMGQNNFPCPLVRGLQADEGPCHDGIPCPFAQTGCPYRLHLRRAMEAPIVVTNYAYWLAQTNFSSGLGDVGLLVLDEAHTAGAFAALENYLTIFISRLDIEPMGVTFPALPVNIPDTPPDLPLVTQQKRVVKGKAALGEGEVVSSSPPPEKPSFWAMWRLWASTALPVARDRLAELEQEAKEYRDAGRMPSHLSRVYRTARSVAARLERLASCGEDWVIQQTHHGYRFVPKWVANYSRHLFGDVPKVMLMSAILSNRTLDYLGVPSSPEERSWVEAGSHFPAANAPIYHIPTARINYRTDDYGSTLWVSRIDQVIQRRLDRKGIVFTVSYERARLLLSRSRYKNIMYTHGTNDVVAVVERFKQATPPAILVSPTVTTGWDFPMLDSGHGMPQYGIIGKVPYPSTDDPVTKERHQDDKEWTSYLAMETLVQTAGRLNRTPDDLAETFVLDDNWVWYWRLYRKFAPTWFHARVMGSLATVPDPLL